MYVVPIRGPSKAFSNVDVSINLVYFPQADLDFEQHLICGFLVLHLRFC